MLRPHTRRASVGASRVRAHSQFSVPVACGAARTWELMSPLSATAQCLTPVSRCVYWVLFSTTLLATTTFSPCVHSCCADFLKDFVGNSHVFAFARTSLIFHQRKSRVHTPPLLLCGGVPDPMFTRLTPCDWAYMLLRFQCVCRPRSGFDVTSARWHR